MSTYALMDFWMDYKLLLQTRKIHTSLLNGMLCVVFILGLCESVNYMFKSAWTIIVPADLGWLKLSMAQTFCTGPCEFKPSMFNCIWIWPHKDSYTSEIPDKVQPNMLKFIYKFIEKKNIRKIRWKNSILKTKAICLEPMRSILNTMLLITSQDIHEKTKRLLKTCHSKTD